MARSLTIGTLVFSLLFYGYIVPASADAPTSGTPACANMMSTPGHQVMESTPACSNFMSTPGHTVVMGTQTQPAAIMPLVQGFDLLDYLY